MYAFVHELALLAPRLDISADAGPEFTPLMRFFKTDTAYLAFRESHDLKHTFKKYAETALTIAPLERVLGAGFPFPADKSELMALAIAEYQLLAGLSAISLPSPDISQYFTPEEFNRIWSIFNMRQYLRYSRSILGNTPALAASALLADIIATTDSYVYHGTGAPVQLRFGHAEASAQAEAHADEEIKKVASEIAAIEDDFECPDWFVAEPGPNTASLRTDDSEFGYTEPPRKPHKPDSDAQLSLF